MSDMKIKNKRQKMKKKETKKEKKKEKTPSDRVGVLFLRVLRDVNVQRSELKDINRRLSVISYLTQKALSFYLLVYQLLTSPLV